MTPYNLKKRVDQTEAKDRWTYLRQCIKQEATKVLVMANDFKGEEGEEANHRFMLISKMLNMKENLQK